MQRDSSACTQWNKQLKILSERITPPPWTRETGPGPSAPKYGGMCPIPNNISIMQQKLNKKQYFMALDCRSHQCCICIYYYNDGRPYCLCPVTRNVRRFWHCLCSMVSLAFAQVSCWISSEI